MERLPSFLHEVGFFTKQNRTTNYSTSSADSNRCLLLNQTLKTPSRASLSSDGKESTGNVGDLDSIPGLGRSPGEGKGYLLQCSGLENSMDCIVHGVAKSWTQLSDFHSLTQSWKWVSQVVKNPPANARDIRDVGSNPGSGRSPGEGNGKPLQCPCLKNPTDGKEPSRLQSLGSQRV